MVLSPLAVLFIGVSVGGVFGAWFVNRKATDVALKGFGAIETGVGVVDAGVGRVDDLIAANPDGSRPGRRDYRYRRAQRRRRTARCSTR